ncbi:hypothetical protein [Oceanobacillus kapialis]|uniref:Uncharacterized protein n=1 Tax=Oceanobacillus kapialis TaxID=481353 RepID=A0ABW5PXR1_9BACI
MALIDKFTEEELLEYKKLKDRMLAAYTTKEIKYYDKKIHDIFDNVEYRSEIENAVETGRVEIIMSLLRNGMSIEQVVKHTSFNIKYIEDIKRSLHGEE